MNNQITLSYKLKAAFQAGQGKTYREIGQNLNISKSSVGRIMQIMNNSSISSGEIDLVNPFKYHFIAVHILHDPLISYRNIAKLSQNFEFKMSDTTINRFAKAMGFKTCFQQHKEKLTAAQKNIENFFQQKSKKLK